MTADSAPDFATVPTDDLDDMDAWIAAQEAKTPFTSFDLGTDEGRQELLRKYYRIGDTSLFEAVSHVWASLNEPRAAYCTLIGVAAGTGGKGKRGLVLMLHKFLAEALDIINCIPPVKDYASLDEWHEASMYTFTKDEEDLCALLEHYSTVLNGGVASKSAGPFAGVVLHGPWAPVSPSGRD
jgi:hypothetical protein